MQTTAARGAWRASLNACSTLLRRPGLSLAATARMSASRRLQRVRGTGKQHGSGFYYATQSAPGRSPICACMMSHVICSKDADAWVKQDLTAVPDFELRQPVTVSFCWGGR